MQHKRLVADDLRSSGEVNYLAWHSFFTPRIALSLSRTNLLTSMMTMDRNNGRRSLRTDYKRQDNLFLARFRHILIFAVPRGALKPCWYLQQRQSSARSRRSKMHRTAPWMISKKHFHPRDGIVLSASKFSRASPEPSALHFGSLTPLHLPDFDMAGC